MNGPDGDWFVNGVDTGVQAQDPAGQQDQQGVPGVNGADGSTPVVTIGPDGNWFVDGVDTNQLAQGPPGASAVIPYASGIPTDINMILGGLAGVPEFIGFGLSAPGASVLGNTIDFTGGTLTNFAFTMPRAGAITDIYASFLIVAGVSIGMNPTVYLYTRKSKRPLFFVSEVSRGERPSKVTYISGKKPRL